MPELRPEPCEWAVIVHRRVYVVIRCVEIDGDDYWRVVTGEDDRAHRRLVGYWGSLEEASHNALAFVERQLPGAWMATGTSSSRTPRAMTPQKPPPAPAQQEPSWPGPRGIPHGVDTVWGAPRRRPRR
ncbi:MULTISPECIES: hypothetical protein [unclassified Agrococcus]|uniref:hypothetical protein n=1 Tax=unclassified Agrococcus TaxID=2615065 RepID=UPI00361BC11B